MDKPTLIAKAAALQAAYRSNEQVLAQLSTITLIAVVGPTGVGKSTVSHKTGLPYVVGDTTRTPRASEVHGRDYNFRTDFDTVWQELQHGDYVQFVVQRSSELYGTRASSYPHSGACTMAVLASAVPNMKSLGFAYVRPVFIVPPSHTEWMRRIAAHRDRDLEARLIEAKESLALALADPTYVYVLNEDLETAAAAMRRIAAGSIDSIASARAHSAANTLYEHLQRTIR